MKTAIVGSIAGVLIVSLALTAGREYGRAEHNDRAYRHCYNDMMTQGELLRSSQQTAAEMTSLAEQQARYIQSMPRAQ